MKRGRIRWKGERERRDEEREEREEDRQDKIEEGQDGKIRHKLCDMERERCDEHTEGRRGRNEGWTVGGRGEKRLVSPYPSHCSHVRPHLIGWFVVSLQEDGKLDRPVRH